MNVTKNKIKNLQTGKKIHDGRGFIISYPKRKSSAYLDNTDTKSQKNNKDKGLKNEKKEK